jgi:penicillin-binding protein 1A
MVLGGLKEGVSPLGWAYAYSTIGNDGDRVSGTLAPIPGDTPVAFTRVTDQEGHTIKGGDNDSLHEQVFEKGTIEEAKSILETVVSEGTGTHAQIGVEGEWGKTGTTEEEGDAWFCGGIQEEVTACVWVGYPDSTTPMTTLYNGGPVMGGTYPAMIWASVMSAWKEIQAEKAAEKATRKAEKAAKEGNAEEAEELEAEAAENSEGEGYEPSEPVEESTESAVPEEEVEAPPAEEERPPAGEAGPEEAAPHEEATPEGGAGGSAGGVTAG